MKLLQEEIIALV